MCWRTGTLYQRLGPTQVHVLVGPVQVAGSVDVVAMPQPCHECTEGSDSGEDKAGSASSTPVDLKHHRSLEDFW